MPDTVSTISTISTVSTTSTVFPSSFAIETKRLWLEQLDVVTHLQDFHEIWSNSKALIWSTQVAKKTVEESHAWMEPMTRSPSRPWIHNYAILLRPTEPIGSTTRPKMIGVIGVHGMADVADGRRCNIGYMINHSYWGQGFATEALEGFLQLWFGDGDNEKEDLVAQVDTENWASIRILQKMADRGYGIREGELEKAVFKIPDKGLRDMRTWYISKYRASNRS